MQSGLKMEQVVPDPKELRILDCTTQPWDSAARGLMFDIENHSDYPVRVSGMQVRIAFPLPRNSLF
jgi:hypothetical protein